MSKFIPSSGMTLADLETKSITDHPRPASPPPVGLAIRLPGKALTYFSWGHPQGTNGTWELNKKGVLIDVSRKYADPKRAATEALKDAYKGPVLGHNWFKFDAPVIEDHLGVKPRWEKFHDTLFTLFLRDPHSPSLNLKDAAERDLGEKPEERDEVFEWLAAHGITSRHVEKGKVKYGSKENPAAAHISEAPGSLVALYAIGDLTRTAGLWDLHQPWVLKEKMQKAYDTERELAPILLENERQGIRVDMAALERDLPGCRAALVKTEDWIRKTLKIKDKDYLIATTGEKRFNFDSDFHVADALRKAQIVKEFPQTDGGRDSVSKKKLKIKFFSDKRVYCAIHFRNTMSTVLTQSMEKWFNEGSQKGGYIYREWNQVRGNDKGARSGRITVSGLANIAKRFGGKDPDYTHPAFMKVPEPPLARDYILPDKGHVFGHSDFDQQEMKIVAHFEDGRLAAKYNEDPKMDAHEFVHDTVLAMSKVDYNRDVIKTVGFRKLYGGGIQGLADQLDIPYAKAKEIVNAWEKAMPDVVALDRALRDVFKDGNCIRTLGGRVYYCKPPAVAKKGPRKGSMIDFFYTALNYVVQPSAADQTKRAIINYHDHPSRVGRLLCTVYDEVNISAPKGHELQELKILQECMVGAIKLDVPVTTTIKVGPSWGQLKKIEKGKKVAA